MGSDEMSNPKINTSLGLEAKFKEAELYRSMGLLGEALGLYEKLFEDVPEENVSEREGIQEVINLLKKEIEDQEREDAERLSAEDISIFKEKLATDEDLPTIRDSASAFKELGLYEEAISEYEKLFGRDYPWAEIIPETVDCYFKIHTGSEALEKARSLSQNANVNEAERAEMMFIFGLEFENREHKDLALTLYKAANALDPENEEISERIQSMEARLSSGSKYAYLLHQNLATTDQLKKALELSKQKKKSVEFTLGEQFNINKDEIGKSLSLFYGCPFRPYDPTCSIQTELLHNLKKSFLLQDLWLPMSWDKDGVEVLLDNPRDLAKTDNIKAILGTKVKFVVGVREDIEAFIKDCFDTKKKDEHAEEETAETDFDLMPDIAFEEDEDIEEEYEEADEASGHIVKLVDQILVAAYRKGTSDIHIEPSPVTKKTMVRFRMDGVCQEYIQVPNTLARGILSRIKILAGLDIAERRLPQDGKIKFKRKGIPSFELRVATLPTAGGFEDTVMRILAKAGAMPLDDMGLLERNLTIMKKIIAQPYGLVLVVGPTGSGKTTSLHAALGHINKPSVKIWTAEDPVEITQQGLRQVEAKPKIGLDFSRIMRAFLRADPDVIMIGEMRDEETASIGVEASLTGHLVFSTLHTNSAPETVTRLLDMGLNPLNFSDAFLGVMAQRLARRLCKNCKEAHHPTEEEFEEIVTDYGGEYFQLTGIEYSEDLTLYRPKGCDECSGVGYKGRLGIHEMMEGTPEIKKLIKKNAPTENLFEQAMKEGMTTLKQDGIIKVFQGMTDIKEIRRIVAN